MKKILLFGGSGFIGTHLVEELYKDYEITILSRDPSRLPKELMEKTQSARLDFSDYKFLVPYFENNDIIINLAGENVDGKWTDAKKELILQSRLSVDNLILEAFSKAAKKPEAIIQGSGIGYYGLGKSDDPVTVEFRSLSNSFLTDVALQHEAILDDIALQTRIVFIRSGIVLDKTGGALPRMAMPVKFFAGRMGDGKQWIPWIHIKDEVRAIRFLIENTDCEWAYNLTSPNPVRQEEFIKALGKALNKSPIFPIPEFFLKAMLGEMADELLLNGLKVVPERLMKTGFKFQFETLEKALRIIYA